MRNTGTPPKNPMDTDRLLSFADDLIQVLKNRKDVNIMMRLLEDAKSLSSSCDADFTDLQRQLKDCQKRASECQQNIKEAEAEADADTELDHLQRELEEALKEEQFIQQLLREVNEEIHGLECQGSSVEEQKRSLLKSERDELKQQKKLSMYASVTNIIPDLAEKGRISGKVVDRDKRIVETFEFDPRKTSDLEICNSLWKLMDGS